MAGGETFLSPVEKPRHIWTVVLAPAQSVVAVIASPLTISSVTVITFAEVVGVVMV